MKSTELCENHCQTQVVHFRGPSVARTNKVFVLGDSIIEIVPHYTYLGLLLTEFIEDEVHVITKCPLYSESREVLYDNARRFNADFDVVSDKEKFVFMFECAEMCGIVAKTCYSILLRRNCFLYR